MRTTDGIKSTKEWLVKTYNRIYKTLNWTTIYGTGHDDAVLCMAIDRGIDELIERQGYKRTHVNTW